MAFRKRNVGISRSSDTAGTPSRPDDPVHTALPSGVRPSPIDGRPTTSTGAPSLDALLAGHAGLALGSSLLIEESGTTDYAGALLRYYAAEGIVQGHKVHVVGLGESWGRELPDVVGVAGGGGGDMDEKSGKDVKADNERMKIAWRYERLGEFGVGLGTGVAGSRAHPAVDRFKEPRQPSSPSQPPSAAFCHTFDLAKRLSFRSGTINYLSPPTPSLQTSPFVAILHNLSHHLSSSPLDIVHRLIIPSLLSPALYPPHSSNPHHVLAFLHSLRALLRQHATRITALITLPLSLYPRTIGLVRWMEILSDGVLELSPFPHLMDSESHALAASGAATAQDEQPQGMLRIHKLPVFHEKGGGGGGLGGLGDDLAFTVSRRKFVIKPFSLPPMEGDTEAQKGDVEAGVGKQTKVDIEF